MTVATALVFVLVTSSARGKLSTENNRVASANSAIRDLSDRIALLRDTASQSGLPPKITWEGDARANIELAMQSAVLGIAQDHQIRMSTFGPATAPSAVTGSTVGYQFEGEGAWGDVVLFVDRLEHLEPALSISELSIRQVPMSGAHEEQSRVGFRASMWGFAPGIEGRK